MYKNTIAIFFSILFLALIAAPTIISAIDDSADTSIFYSITEEENGNLKIAIPDNGFKEVEPGFETTNVENLSYYFKNYAKPHLNLISPPPDFI